MLDAVRLIIEHFSQPFETGQEQRQLRAKVKAEVKEKKETKKKPGRKPKESRTNGKDLPTEESKQDNEMSMEEALEAEDEAMMVQRLPRLQRCHRMHWHQQKQRMRISQKM